MSKNVDGWKNCSSKSTIFYALPLSPPKKFQLHSRCVIHPLDRSFRHHEISLNEFITLELLES